MKTVAEIISSNPLNPVRGGLVRRRMDNKIFRFSQNPIEVRIGFAMLFEMGAAEIPISDLDCVLCGIDFGSKFIIPLPGLYDINHGFEIITQP